MPDHVVTTDNETLRSRCSCGAKAPTVDIRRHIEAEEADRSTPVRPAPRPPEPEPVVGAEDHVVPAEDPHEKPRRRTRRGL